LIWQFRLFKTAKPFELVFGFTFYTVLRKFGDLQKFDGWLVTCR